MWGVIYLDPNRVQQPFSYTANPWYFPDRQLSHKLPNNFRVKLKVELPIWLVLEDRYVSDYPLCWEKAHHLVRADLG